MSLTKEERNKRSTLLKQCPLFRVCSKSTQNLLVENMKPEKFEAGQIIRKQGEPTRNIYILDSGDVAQTHERGDHHQNFMGEFPKCYGSLDLLQKTPAQYSVVAKTPTTIYKLPRDFFIKNLGDSHFSQDIIMSLSSELRSQSFFTRTPLLEQRNDQPPLMATSIAATFESFYRSALNSMINRRLTGLTSPLFPNMHIQVPSRVMYINGFKYVRYWVDQKVHPENYPGWQMAVGLGCAVVPGIVMTPVSSILEACNATTNTEPIYSRWLRGIVPRCAREIIFGIGLNQLSEYFAERTPSSLPDGLSTMFGSLCAGVVSGYLSHVPHNLSTMKLIQPQLSYSEHFRALAMKWQDNLLFVRNQQTRSRLAFALSILAPRGLFVRTTQVVGSFIILNSIIHIVKEYGFENASFAAFTNKQAYAD